VSWIFDGPCGGSTVEAGAGKVRLAMRYYDSSGLSKVPPVQSRPGRHPEGLWEEVVVEYSGSLLHRKYLTGAIESPTAGPRCVHKQGARGHEASEGGEFQ
jgi:hypothetical protein